jgi:hypothetical protein
MPAGIGDIRGSDYPEFIFDKCGLIIIGILIKRKGEMCVPKGRAL